MDREGKAGSRSGQSFQGRNAPLHLELVATDNKEKAIRAAPLANKMERSEVFLPKDNFDWRQGFQRELLSWTGHKRETSDQIDAAAYAAIIAQTQSPGILTIHPVLYRA